MSTEPSPEPRLSSQERRDRRARRRTLIAMAVVLVITLLILLSRGHLGTFFGQLLNPDSADTIQEAPVPVERIPRYEIKPEPEGAPTETLREERDRLIDRI